MKKVCFVCLGNICRSPMAEFVMKEITKETDFTVVSRGTSAWEHGNPIHQGTQAVLKKNAISYDRKKHSQQITRQDLEDFDYIIGMDEQNVIDLKHLSNKNFDSKIFLFTEGGVPDPWFTGNFDDTYRLVERGCKSWLEKVDTTSKWN